MKHRHKIVLVLAGGLGNQLFQYAHALSRGPNSEIIIDSTILQPRKNKNGIPELLDLELPGNYISKTIFKRKTKFLRRFCSLLLRIGSGKLPIIQKSFLIFLSKPILSLVYRIFNGEWLTVKIAKDVGFSEMSALKSATIYIGYFQSYKWVQENENILSAFRGLEPKVITTLTSDLCSHSKGKIILGIHIRLGDYRQEKKIGLLPTEYYERAIRYLANREYDEIWIFTNDIEGARDIVSILPKFRQVWIPGNLSSAETLHLMTFCNDFIISNSTFSWWGAYLNRNCSGTIICPETWFEKAADPAEICPPGWVRVKSFDKEKSGCKEPTW